MYFLFRYSSLIFFSSSSLEKANFIGMTIPCQRRLLHCFIFCSSSFLYTPFCKGTHYYGGRGLVWKATWVTKVWSQSLPWGHSSISCVRKKSFLGHSDITPEKPITFQISAVLFLTYLTMSCRKTHRSSLAHNFISH